MFPKQLPEGDILSDRISVIVFSKDRPLQLQAYLESLFYYSGMEESSVYVLYKKTDISYQNLIDKYSDVNWIAEKDFYSDLIAIINKAGEFILWGCDDVFFKSFFNPEVCVKSLKEDSNILAFSLRLGKNIHPYSQLINRQKYLLCDWTNAPESYWSYPWEVSASIYRTKDVLDLIKIANNITNPNYLEGNLVQYFAIHKENSRRYIACFEKSKSLTLTINRVQDTYLNWFDATVDSDIESLYKYFLEGYHLNWWKFAECDNTVVHVRSEYFQIDPPDQKSKSFTDNINLQEIFKNHLTRSNLAEAAAALHQFFLEKKNYALAYVNVAKELSLNGKIHQAIKSYQLSLEINPDCIESYLGLGDTWETMQQTEEAIKYYQKALELSPDDPSLYEKIGRLLESLGNYEAALNCWLKLSEIQPDKLSADCWLQLAESMRKQGKMGEAEIAYAHTIRLDVHSFWSYYHLACIWLNKGEVEEAIGYYKRAIEINPEFSWSYHHLATALAKQGNLEDAITSFRQAIQKNLDHFGTYYGLGKCLVKLGQLDGAIEAFLKALELESYQDCLKLDLIDAIQQRQVRDNQLLAQNHYYLFQSCWQQARKEEALNYLHQITISHPEILDAKDFEHLFSASLEKQNLHQRELYYQAIAKHPQAGKIYQDIGLLFYQKNQWDQTLYCWLEVKKLQPDLLDLEKLDQLGQIFIQQEHWEQAISCYRCLFEINPGCYSYVFNFGHTLQQKQDFREAARCYLKALQIEPDRWVYIQLLAGVMASLGRPEESESCRVGFVPNSIIKEFCQPDIQWSVSHARNSQSCVSTMTWQPPETVTHLHASTTISSATLNEAFKEKSAPSESTPFAALIESGRGWSDTYNRAIIGLNHELIDDLSYGSPGLIASSPYIPNALSIKGTVAFLSKRDCVNYYHWMIELLPQIRILQDCNIDLSTIDKFVVNNIDANYKVESLRLLGISTEKILESSKFPHIQADRLWVTTPIYESQVWAIQFLRQSFLKEIRLLNDGMINHAEKNQRIYIVRENAPNRRSIINGDEVLNFLTNLGFKPVRLETMSLLEQVFLFSRAEIIVAPHGAGLTNVIFCPLTAKVIEFFNPGYVNPCYWKLCNQVGLKHYHLIDNNKSSQFNDPYDPFLKDMFVDLHELQELIKIVDLSLC
ncbi:tetratricopeptide repeat protein [Microcoleus sp. POL10_C6]|uniref:tetratricopeptide repeat protein n=1 Tax=Microcoleus sp. POL10_C6 TaxID=2818852 RepID=UPI002FD644BD